LKKLRKKKGLAGGLRRPRKGGKDLKARAMPGKKKKVSGSKEKSRLSSGEQKGRSWLKVEEVEGPKKRRGNTCDRGGDCQKESLTQKGAIGKKKRRKSTVPCGSHY